MRLPSTVIKRGVKEVGTGRALLFLEHESPFYSNPMLDHGVHMFRLISLPVGNEATALGSDAGRLGWRSINILLGVASCILYDAWATAA
jgi:hypothetical protein